MNLLLIGNKIVQRDDTDILEKRDAQALYAHGVALRQEYHEASIVVSNIFGKWTVVKNRFGEVGQKFSTRTVAEEFMSGHKPS